MGPDPLNMLDLQGHRSLTGKLQNKRDVSLLGNQLDLQRSLIQIISSDSINASVCIEVN